MPDFFANLGELASQNQPLAYLIIYIGTIFFGNISAFVSFWLVLHGAFGPWGVPLLMATLFASVLSGDLLWYGLGRGLHNTRIGYFFRNRFAPQHEKVEEALIKNGRAWIFVSKFLYASSAPFIFTVGWVGVPFKKFFRSSLLSVAAWLPVIVGVSYGLIASLTPLQAVDFMRDFGIAFAAGVALFLLAYYYLAKFLKKLFLRVFRNGTNGFSER